MSQPNTVLVSVSMLECRFVIREGEIRLGYKKLFVPLKHEAAREMQMVV